MRKFREDSISKKTKKLRNRVCKKLRGKYYTNVKSNRRA